MRWSLLALLCVACRSGEPPLPNIPLDGSGYLTSCTKDDECAAVYFGNVCDCRCVNAAISTSEVPAYIAAAAAASSRCRNPRMCKCLDRAAHCVGGRCQLK